jgi:D-3-phosphoglycerate dehydrogenase / 2-oxoglutarate reductase
MKVVITDWDFENLFYEEKVFMNYPEIEFVSGKCRTEDKVLELCHDADAIINQYAPITRRVIESLTNCKLIARYGVGVDTIDLKAATEMGIAVGNVPDYGIDEVSDHALSLILNVLRKVSYINNKVKQGIWDLNLTKPVHRLNETTIGLVGFGNIPRALNEKLQSLKMNVIVSDPYVSDEIMIERNAEPVSLEELCRRADIISVHAPLTDSTKGMIGKAQFELMKDGVKIVNTARGPVIDEAAFIDALKSGKVSAAALDVLENEPISVDHPFLKMEQVVLTPHMAGYSEEAYAELRTKTALAVVDVLIYGQIPRKLVNQEVINKITLKPFTKDSHYQSQNYKALAKEQRTAKSF